MESCPRSAEADRPRAFTCPSCGAEVEILGDKHSVEKRISNKSPLMETYVHVGDQIVHDCSILLIDESP